jgi:hypothetical protein
VASRAPSTSVTAATTGRVPRSRVEPGTTAAQFLEYVEANPGLYAALVEVSRQLRRERPGCRLSIAEVHERVRWHPGVKAGEAGHLSNSWRPYFARLIAAREVDLRDAFELRPSRADELIMDPPELPADDGRLW